MENLDSRLVGFISGADYNKDTKKWVMKKIGDKGAGLKLSVSAKKKDGEGRDYGLDVPIVCWLENGSDDARKIQSMMDSGMVVVEGYFKPNNWTNKEGTLIKGMQFNTDINKIWSKDDYLKMQGGGSLPVVTINDSDLPF